MAEAVVSSGFAEKDFQGSSVSIHYAEGPRSGPPLLLLHGMARDWQSFSVLLPDLASRFHVFALDLRGHGRSGRVPGGYRMFQFAEDVAEFVRAFAPQGTAVFGHSLGAMVGMCAASLPDHRITALIVGDSMMNPENMVATLYRPLFYQMHQLMLAGLSHQDLAYGIGKIQIMLPGFDEPLQLDELAGNSEPVLLEWARSIQQMDPDVLGMSLDRTAYEHWDPEQVLPRISCPVLLLQGNPELDALLSDSDAELAMRLLPRAEHIKFHLLGHALFMQQAKPVLQAVNEFLGKHSALRR